MEPLVSSGKVSDINYLIIDKDEIYLLKIDTPFEHYELKCNNWIQAKETLEKILLLMSMRRGYEISGYL